MSQPTSEFDRLLFPVRRSVRYHDLRKQHFERINNLVMFAAFLLSTGTVATLIEELGVSLIVQLLLPLLAAVLLGISLVSRVSAKASIHNDLKRRFITLEQAIVKKTDNWKASDILEWTGVRLAIEADELPVKRILDVICHNDVMRADGYEETHPDWWRVGFFQRIFSQYFDFRRHALRRNKDATTLWSRLRHWHGGKDLAAS